ncbi:hypothetical protein JTL50_33185, partial [Pseudomonas aeruginosa]|nr:hypothetical protein [Pseudomonas aeruginosa]
MSVSTGTTPPGPGLGAGGKLGVAARNTLPGPGLGADGELGDAARITLPRIDLSADGNHPIDALPYPYDHLIKIWIIETTNTPLSAKEKQARTSVARKMLSLIDGDLYEQSESTITGLNLGARSADRLRPFLAFCAEKGVMRKVNLKGSDNRDR